jgi:hypothetical protein
MIKKAEEGKRLGSLRCNNVAEKEQCVHSPAS